MCMLTKRTNILFDKELWNQLTELARIEQVSVGELVRTAVEEKYLEDNRLEKIKRACQSIKAIRKRFKGKIDYKALINYGRK